MSDIFGLTHKKTELDSRQHAALSLAYLGDAVYELLVRAHIACVQNVPPGKLHERAKRFVSAEGQSARLQALLPHLNEEELAVYKRGRNAQPRSRAKNASAADYQRATGLEALFGYLYLSAQRARLEELFAIVCLEVEEPSTREEGL